MKLRKFMAGTLAVAMVAGSSMMAFAADQTGEATGTGTSVGHVDKEILTVTLPTNTDNVFDYWVDPERVIDEAGALKDGTTVTQNTEGVYFKKSNSTYASTSEKVVFTGQNSVAVDVSVTASVVATDESKDIALVADDAALTAASTPALLMNLTVGADTKAITSDGATAKATLDGVPNNFKITASGGEYKYAIKDDADATAWKKAEVTLSGKTNNKVIASDMTAPKIKLTWTIVKHVDSYLSATTMSASSNSVTLSLPTGVSLEKVELAHSDGTGALELTNQYTFAETTLTVPAENITTWITITPDNYTKLILTYSDNKSETITLQ